jgi:hypothetical protein
MHIFAVLRFPVNSAELVLPSEFRCSKFTFYPMERDFETIKAAANKLLNDRGPFFHWEAPMRRKTSSRAIPKNPPRKSLSRTSLKRGLAAAHATKTPVQRIIISPNGDVSLIIGKVEDHESKNPWDEVLTQCFARKAACLSIAAGISTGMANAVADSARLVSPPT